MKKKIQKQYSKIINVTLDYLQLRCLLIEYSLLDFFPHILLNIYKYSHSSI